MPRATGIRHGGAQVARGAAFDVSAACSGFLYALETGTNFIRTGRYNNVLVEEERLPFTVKPYLK